MSGACPRGGGAVARRFLPVARVGLLLTLVVGTTGCATAIGSGMGALVAEDAPAAQRMASGVDTPAEFERRYQLEVGDEITVTLRSGTLYQGVYLGARLQEDPQSPFVLRLQTRGARRSGGRLARPSLPRTPGREPDQVLSIRVGAIAAVQGEQPRPVAMYVLGGIGLVLDALVLGAALAVGAAIP